MFSVTRGIIIFCILWFLIIGLYGSWLNPDTETLYLFGGLFPPLLFEEGQWWRLVSSLFVHGGLLHLAANCYSLHNVGPFLEEMIGKPRFLLVYLVTGVAAGVNASIWSSDAVIVGASGAIFGIFATQIMLLIRKRHLLSKSAFRSIVRSLLLVLVINLAIGFSIPNISNAGHIGGMIAGAILAYIPSISNSFEKNLFFESA